MQMELLNEDDSVYMEVKGEDFESQVEEEDCIFKEEEENSIEEEFACKEEERDEEETAIVAVDNSVVFDERARVREAWNTLGDYFIERLGPA